MGEAPPTPGGSRWPCGHTGQVQVRKQFPTFEAEQRKRPGARRMKILGPACESGGWGGFLMQRWGLLLSLRAEDTSQSPHPLAWVVCGGALAGHGD